MIRRTTRHLLELLGALLAAGVVLLGIAVWFVASGPIPLTIFKPTLADALAEALEVSAVDFDRAAIAWQNDPAGARLMVREARLYDGRGDLAAELPSLDLVLSARGLLRGLLAPSRIAFAGASARIIRGEDGRLGFGFAAPGSEDREARAAEANASQANPQPVPSTAPTGTPLTDETDTGKTAPKGLEAQGTAPDGLDGTTETTPDPVVTPVSVPEERDEPLGTRLLSDLTRPGSPRTALGYLESIRVDDASLMYEDRSSGLILETDGASFDFERRRDPDAPDGAPLLDLTLNADVRMGDDVVQVRLEGTHRANASGDAAGRSGTDMASELKVNFSDLDVAGLLSLAPALKTVAPVDLERLDLPVRGTVRLALDSSGTPHTLGLDLLAGPGQYALIRPETLPLGEAEHMPRLLAKVPDAVRVRSLAVAADIDLGARQARIHGLTLQTDEADVTLAGGLAIEDGRMRFDIEGDDLVVFVPVYSDRPAGIDRLVVRGSRALGGEPSPDAMVLDEVNLTTAGGELVLSGRLGVRDGEPDLHLDGQIDGFPAEQLMGFWPDGVAMGARDWIDRNIQTGRIGEGTFALRVSPGTLDDGYLPNEALRLDFTLEDVTTGFIPGLPNMTDLDGKATLQGDRFEAQVKRARIGRIQVSEGRMLTDELHVKGSPGVFDVVMEGPFADLLQLLDQGPFGYPSRYGIDSVKAGGEAGVRLNVALPMERDLQVGDIEFSAAANVQDLYLPSAVGGVDLSDGDFSLRINGAGLEGSGDVSLGGLPARLSWTEDFTGSSDEPTQFAVSAVLDEETRRTLGLETGGQLSGPIALSLRAGGRGSALDQVALEADLTAAGLDLAPAWSKAPGAPASARMHLRLLEDGGILAEDVRATGSGLDVEGRFELAKSLRLLSAEFSRMNLRGLSDLSLTVARGEDGLDINLVGPYLNAAPFLLGLDEMGSGGGGSGTAASSGAAAAPETRKEATRLAFQARIERLDVQNEVVLDDASVRLTLIGQRLDDLVLRSGLAERSGSGEGQREADTPTGTIHVAIERKNDEARSVIATTTNAGALARGLLDVTSLSGGQLRLNALITEDEVEGSDGATQGRDRQIKESLAGRLTVEDFRLVDVPTLAQIFQLGSFTGLGDLLQGEGIRFSALSLPFEGIDGQWRVYDGRAVGPSVGLTLDGTFDPDMKGSDLKGTIVPAYGINSALGRLPLIGDIFVGREGEGVFGVTYRVLGSEDGSNVYVNPLSALAPGVLRRIFQIGDRSDGPEPAPEIVNEVGESQTDIRDFIEAETRPGETPGNAETESPEAAEETPSAEIDPSDPEAPSEP